MDANPAINESTIHAEVLVLGGGPGGYTAAFRAADLGKQVVLIERYPALGGVCLNVGCIPSKALLHVAQIIHEVDEFEQHGLSYGKPAFDIDKIRTWKAGITKTLGDGLAGLIKQRKITLLQGTGQFTSSNTVEIKTEAGIKTVSFDQAIIAAGSHPTKIPVFPNDDPRLLDSTDALELKEIPKKLLIVGGGIIGLEMATVYHALGSEISVVELMDQIIPGCDNDLVTPLYRRIKKQYKNIWLETRVAAIEAQQEGLKVSLEGKSAPDSALFDAVLVAVGRKPNGKLIGAELAGVNVDELGFIAVDKQQRTNVPHIFAIGDIVGNPMLAHKASHQGKVAAEVAAGLKSGFDALTIPAVAYTDPEVTWMGLTENLAKQQGIDYDKAVFPWAASGRSLSLGRKEGLTKILCEKGTGRILGAGMVGPNAGELIAEAVLALEMGADAEDVGLTIHPHPMLSETFAFAAEMITGSITDLYIKKKA
jgi:dihydrolipoamide dehydrogenase